MRYTVLLLAALCVVVSGCSLQEHPGASGPAPVVGAGAQVPTHCPECGGALVTVGTVHDDTEYPSKNIAVWNRSICGNSFYGPDSLICTNCWLALSRPLDRWERSSELPESFRRPLVAAIRQCPLPRPEDTKSRVVYSQEVGVDGVKESLAFWCVDSAAFLTHVEAFAREHKLSFRIEQQGRIAHQVFVVIEAKTAA